MRFNARRSRVIKSLLLCLITLICVHISGFIDHLLATPFDQFKWPPFIDIRRQVDLLLNGQPSEYAFVNDWHNSYVLMPKIDDNCDTHPSLLIVVKSSIDHFANRRQIRNLWGISAHNYSGVHLRTIFIVGESTDPSLRQMIRHEHDQFADILLIRSIDNYKNNTYKLIAALEYAKDFCTSGATFLFLVDDDYHVSPRNLIRRVQQQSLHYSIDKDDLYTGYRFDSSPFRFRLHKHFISLTDYPYDAYPPYISAGAVLMSRRTIIQMNYASRFIGYFPYDDIYAGIIAYLLHIDATHERNIYFWPKTFVSTDYAQIIAAHGFERIDDMTQAYRATGD